MKNNKLDLQTLIADAESWGACFTGRKFLKSCRSVEDCLENCRSDYLVFVLIRRPEYSKLLDAIAWNKLDGDDWRELLTEQPQFSEYCDWSRISGYDWRELLVEQPQFSEYCDWSRLDGYDWVSLLIKQPQFAEYCDWDLLGVYDWLELLTEQPQLSEYYD